jgi:hypothetical protein
MCSNLIKETGESIILSGYDFDHFDHALATVSLIFGTQYAL